MPRVVHFEIPADSPERVIKFYEETFGWSFNKWDGPLDYWLIKTGEKDQMGIDGGLMRKQEGSSVANTIDVPDLDEYVKKITDAGGTITVPKMAVPGVGWLAYFKDPEGNLFGIMQPDMKAKQQ